MQHKRIQGKHFNISELLIYFLKLRNTSKWKPRNNYEIIITKKSDLITLTFKSLLKHSFLK